MLAACAVAGLAFGCGGAPDGSLSTDSPLITWEAPSEADLLGEEPVIEDTGPDEMPPELQQMLNEGGGGGAANKAGGGEANKAKAPPAKKGAAKDAPAKKGAPAKKDAPAKKGQP